MKFKKQLVNIRVYSKTDSSGKLEPVESYVLGNWSYRKETYEIYTIKGTKTVSDYSITHNPSGFRVSDGLPNEKSARNACIALESCPAKWDGQGTTPKDFDDQIGEIARKIRYGTI